MKVRQVEQVKERVRLVQQEFARVESVAVRVVGEVVEVGLGEEAVVGQARLAAKREEWLFPLRARMLLLILGQALKVGFADP